MELCRDDFPSSDGLDSERFWANGSSENDWVANGSSGWGCALTRLLYGDISSLDVLERETCEGDEYDEDVLMSAKGMVLARMT